MTREEFLARLRTGRAEWQGLLTRIGRDRMLEPGAAGHWSVKDVIAHVEWGEREMIGVLAARALTGSELWNRSQDERNAAVYEQNRTRTLADVLAAEQAAYDEVVAGIEALAEEDLTDARRFREMPADWEPWQLLASNTYQHYEEHIPSLRSFAKGHE